MVLINGKKEQAAGKTIAGIVEEYNYDIKTIAVELNEEIVSKCDYGKTILKEDDVVEVVSFVGGAKRFADEVLDTGKTDNRANHATGDNTGTRSSWLHENMGASDLGFNFVADSFAIHVDGDHIFLSTAFGFLDGASNVSTLCHTDTNFILVVTNSYESLEAHAATAFDGAGYAVDADIYGIEFFLTFFSGAAVAAIVAAAATEFALSFGFFSSDGFVSKFGSTSLVDYFRLLVFHIRTPILPCGRHQRELSCDQHKGVRHGRKQPSRSWLSLLSLQFRYR